MNIFNQMIPCTITKGFANSNLYISIESGEVVVNAPWYVSKKRIMQVMEEKKQWIISQINEYQKVKQNSFLYGNIQLLGNSYQVFLKYKSICAPSINLNKNSIEVILPYLYKKLTEVQTLTILTEKLYKEVSEKEIDSSMEKARLLLGIAPENFKIQSLPNKLSNCYTEDKTIIINPTIAKYSKDVIDYVVFHEFCHLKYKIHTKGFWNMIEKQFPNYQKYEELLKNSHL